VNDAAPRYRLDLSEDWRALIRHFELGGGFAFLVLLVPDREGERACRETLAEFLRERGQTIVDVQCGTPEELEYVAQPLLELKPDESVGAVWLGRVVEKGSPDEPAWSEAWRRAVARLNQFRNPLRRAFSVPLVFAGAPQLQVILRENAPDLWSVRTLVSFVMPVAAAFERMPEVRSLEQPAYRPDPELAMEEVERGRKAGVSGLDLARALHRAGLGFAARLQWVEARAVFTEALELRRTCGGSMEAIAETALQLGLVLNWMNEHDGAMALFEEAAELYRRHANVLGEASSIEAQGDVELSRSRDELARRRYDEALPMYRKARSVVGEANCVWNLGEIAMLRSEYNEARRRFEEALPIYRQVGSALGEANCVMRLGAVAMHRSELEEALRRTEEALPMYRLLGEVLGEAECVMTLGDIAFIRSGREQARQHYEEALPMFRRAGDHLGEANCIRRLGQIAVASGETTDAKTRFEQALTLYEHIGTLYSAGVTHRLLARVAADAAERARHVEAARACWSQIGRSDLLAKLDNEFGPRH
jgi:tetratricopeptide (TPR) repeat protein